MIFSGATTKNQKFEIKDVEKPQKHLQKKTNRRLPTPSLRILKTSYYTKITRIQQWNTRQNISEQRKNW